MQGICASGGSAVVNYRCIAPPVHNDPQLTTLLERCAVECLGRDKYFPSSNPPWGPKTLLSCFGMCRE